MKVGEQLGIGVPFAKPFPVQDFAGRHHLFVVSAIGPAPLQAVIDDCLPLFTEKAGWAGVYLTNTFSVLLADITSSAC